MIFQLSTPGNYNRKRIMRRAWFLYKNHTYHTFSQSLKAVWKEEKEYVGKQIAEQARKEENEIRELRQLWEVKYTHDYGMEMAAKTSPDTSWW